MAVWSEIYLYEVARADRFDAEHFRPDYVRNEELVNEHSPQRLGAVALNIARGMQPQYDEGGKIPVLRTVNVQNGYLTETRQEFVSADFWAKNTRGQVAQGDILITSTGVGTLGRVTYNPHSTPFFADGHITIVRNVRDHDPQFVALFLQSKVGLALIERRYRGSSGQIEIYPDDIAAIPIPTFGQVFESEIVKACQEAQRQGARSLELYAEAETLLLDALGLNDLDTSDELTYEANFREVATAGRFDSEYYRPKYTNVISHLQNMPHTKIGVAAGLAGGATPLGADYLEEGIPFLRIQNVGSNALIRDDIVYIDSATHNDLLERSQLLPGDVLITITGRIGTAAVVPEDLPVANINQHIVRLRLHDKKLDPYYMAAFLNSYAGRFQTEREAYGSTREALPYYCLQQIIIPILPDALQAQVRNIILQAGQTQREAHLLLEIAKRRVEELIEGGA